MIHVLPDHVVDRIADGREWLVGAAPTLADVAVAGVVKRPGQAAAVVGIGPLYTR